MRAIAYAAVLATISFPVSATVANSAMTAPMSAVAWTQYELKLRSGSNIAGELGTIKVPQVRSDPNSGAIGLRFVRLRSTGGKGPPIVYLAGGPGSSGIEAAQGDRWALFDRLRKHGDVILLDQRGIGLSDKPPECSRPWQPPVSGDAASTARSVERAARLCAEEWRAKGIRLNAYTVAESVADIATLVGALGVPKVRIVGISYGTFLGLALLRDHSALVDSAILAGTEGPDHTLKLPLEADRSLEALSRHLLKRRGTKFDLAVSVRRLFAKLAEAPAEVAMEGGKLGAISLYDAQAVTFFLMGSSNNWPRLEQLLTAADSGDLAPFVQTVSFLHQFYGALPAMPLATDATSPSSPARQHLIKEQAEQSLFGDAVNFPGADFAAAFRLKQLGPSYYGEVRTDVPTLFISGTLDPRTPERQADEVRRGFRHQAHLVIDGAGHDNDLFLSTPVILDRIEAFFSIGTLADERVRAVAPPE